MEVGATASLLPQPMDPEHRLSAVLRYQRGRSTEHQADL